MKHQLRRDLLPQVLNGEAREAELADALDSGFHFRRFQRAASRFNKSDITPHFTD
jgi:hypothetical protein